MNGLLLIDKPVGMTSHDVVARVRRTAGMHRVGHTGTLDPRATGLLVLCLGNATRLSEHLTGLDKTYEGSMRLGVTTDSYDLDGTTIEEKEIPATLTREMIQEACTRFVGDIQQVPPMVSAVKVDGKRLYKWAREGREIERKPRQIAVHAFDITGWQPPEAGIRVVCSSGAYVRALCHDAGVVLGCGATLARLRRTHVGEFALENALPLDELRHSEDVSRRLIPMEKALALPEIRVDGAREHIVRSGGVFSVSGLPIERPLGTGWVQIKDALGALLALGVVQPTAMGMRIRPKRVFPAQ